jgi:hypothetical protein
MRIYSFAKDAWNEEEWSYAASKVTPYRTRFIQEDAYIKNNRLDGSNGYEYISMVLKEKFTKNIRVEVEASFEKYGAPLIVLSNDLKSLDNGSIEYGTHYEIVAYECFLQEKFPHFCKNFSPGTGGEILCQPQQL